MLHAAACCACAGQTGSCPAAETMFKCSLAGDMATWHQAADPLLSSDISALAHTVSRHMHTCTPGEDLGAAMAAAVAATAAPAGASGSRVATLIVPHDLSWEHADQPANGSSQPVSVLLNRAAVAAGVSRAAPLDPAAQQFVRDAAAALKACPRGKAALYIGGRAALAEGERRRKGMQHGTFLLFTSMLWNSSAEELP